MSETVTFPADLAKASNQTDKVVEEALKIMGESHMVNDSAEKESGVRAPSLTVTLADRPNASPSLAAAIESPFDSAFMASLTRKFQEATMKAAQAHRARLAGELQPQGAHW